MNKMVEKDLTLPPLSSWFCNNKNNNNKKLLKALETTNIRPCVTLRRIGKTSMQLRLVYSSYRWPCVKNYISGQQTISGYVMRRNDNEIFRGKSFLKAIYKK